MADFQIPSELEKRLFVSDKKLANKLVARLYDFADLLVGDKLEFFVEYTDHSIEHVNKVLENIEDLMTIDTLEKLNSLDSAILIVAVMLHDIGMKATIELFQNMLKGSYDYNQPGMPKEKNIYNDKSWIDLWDDYVKESQFWNEEKINNVIGESVYTVSSDDLRHKILEDPNELNGKDKRFIGEFIRRHHGRIAYEVAIRGYWGYNENRIVLNDALDEEYLQLAGMVARSHSMGLRKNYNFLEKITDKTHYKSPYDIDIILHMVLIRLSDYLHVDKDRTNKTVLYLRKTYSPYSLREHQKHLAISNIRFKEEEETISITVNSHIENAELFVSIEQLVNDIQSEFDTCWAVLGEQYSNKYKLKYRRITSNLSQDGESSVRNSQKYVPKLFGFKFNNKLLELLIEPLYGKNPSYGVRELVQNAVDACRTRMALDKGYNAKENFTHVTVSLDPDTKLFRIVDTGIGMNTEEIEKYFLAIGSSYSSSIDWQRTRDEMNKDSNNKFYRTGRFGIGILAAFLLGPIIHVKTKRYNSKQGYQFTLRLDQDFIQIDKVDLPDYGTSIEIECKKEALKSLKYDIDYYYNDKYSGCDKDLGSDKWFGWYIDSKPKVEYRYHGKVMKLNYSNRFNCFKHLPTNSSGCGDIYWKPIVPFINEYIGRGYGGIFLFCNGFFVTRFSRKSSFSISGIEKYISCGIPYLKVTDIVNELPLNLRRDDIDPNVEYRFEKDLAVAMCKDILCQLLAINRLSLDNNKTFLFFHQSGYSINRHSLDYLDYDNLDDYPEAILHGKYLVHIFNNRRKWGGNRFRFHSWEQFIANHPEAVLSVYNDESFDNSMDKLYALFRYLYNPVTVNHKLKHCSIAVLCEDWKEAINHHNRKDLVKQTIKIDNIPHNDYNLICHDSLNTELVRDLFSHIDSLQDEEKPWFILINHVEGKTINSPLDYFINEYAGGDMIVPYDENERRKKFAKLYAECGDEIERYRIYYQESHQYKIVSNKLGEKSIKDDENQI